MLVLQGDRSFARPRDVVWTRLTDLGFLVKCLPDVARLEEVGPKTAKAVVRPGFSFVRGELQLTLERQADPAPFTACYLARTKGVGTSTEVLATLALAEDPAQAGTTRMAWQVEIRELGGLLKAVPRGLIQAGAQKVVADLLSGIERELAHSGT
ncbi:MAG: SRPBCC domain-containing protein [Gemmatales bacterium]|nr:SRPBCC domain-containing protein [Gemmatales bacterium]MDW8387525.1 SRPBCC domain-containing protein [Gemmatales bacterium]